MVLTVQIFPGRNQFSKAVNVIKRYEYNLKKENSATIVSFKSPSVDVPLARHFLLTIKVTEKTLRQRVAIIDSVRNRKKLVTTQSEAIDQYLRVKILISPFFTSQVRLSEFVFAHHSPSGKKSWIKREGTVVN